MEEPDRSPSLLCVTYTADITASFPLDRWTRAWSKAIGSSGKPQCGVSPWTSRIRVQTPQGLNQRSPSKDLRPNAVVCCLFTVI